MCVSDLVLPPPSYSLTLIPLPSLSSRVPINQQLIVMRVVGVVQFRNYDMNPLHNHSVYHSWDNLGFLMSLYILVFLYLAITHLLWFKTFCVVKPAKN